MDSGSVLRFRAGKLLRKDGQLVADPRRGRVELARVSVASIWMTGLMHV